MLKKNVIEERYIRRNTVEPFELLVAKGLVKGHSFIHKFGANFDVDNNSTPESIWTAGGLYPWSALSTAQTLYLKSSDSGDTDTVTVQGLDSNYELLEEIVTLTGTTAVTTTNQFLRVYRMIYNHGSSNAGDITAHVTSASGTVVAQIDEGLSQTLMAIYTVPAGYTAYLYCGDASIQKNKDGRIDFYQRPFGAAFRIAHMGEVFEGTYRYDFPIPIPLAAKTDLDVRITDVESNNTRVAANFDMILVSDTAGD